MIRYLLLFDSYGLVFVGALFDERTGLSFVYDAGPRQSSLSRVQVPWDSWPYFTLSDLRLPFSSPPTTRRVTVEVFEPASTRVCNWSKVKVTLRLTVSQSVSLDVEPHLGLMTRYLLPFDSYDLVFVGRSLWRETGLSFIYAAGPRQHSLPRVRVPWNSWPYFTLSDLRLLFSSPPTTRRITVEVFEPASTRVCNWRQSHSLLYNFWADSTGNTSIA
jgi:hypothetical protein